MSEHHRVETKELYSNFFVSALRFLLTRSDSPVLSEDYSAESVFDEGFQQHQRDEMQ